MMRDVFVNGRFLTHKISGITRFSIELCKELKKLGCNFVIVIPKWFEYDNHENHNIVRYGNMKSHFWEQIELLNFLKSKENPILLNLSGLGPLWYKNKIIAIHDLSFYVNSKWFSKTYTIFYSIATPIAARNSIKVLTVSEFSKGEIIKYLSVDADDIIVIYNAVSKKFAAGIENVPKRIIQQKYILAVSSIDPRKNIQRLINVFNNNYIGDYKLVLVGSKEGHFNINFKNNSDRVIYKGFVSEEDLLSLYSHCTLFIYPSLYEGFGIPPLEAMKYNCPVIVSDIPSLREVCDNAVLYVDPYDEIDIKEGILRLLNDFNLQMELKGKGEKRSELFSWENSAKKLRDLLNVTSNNI